MDDYGVHWDSKVVWKTEQSNIQLFAVPKGTTALAQPLDLSINGTMKQHRQNSWSKEDFMAHPRVDLVQNAVIRASENIMQKLNVTHSKGI